jgi:cell wall-associated NlpC family hydrolase
VTASPLEPRLNPYRPDIADVRLKGKVDSARFIEGTLRRVVAPVAPLKREPRSDAGLDTQVLHGEAFRVFEDLDEGWSWGQLETDSYVGYVPTDALGPPSPKPTHRVGALRTFLYPGPDMKLPAIAPLSFGSAVALSGSADTRGTHYRLLARGEGAIVAAHAVPFDAPPEPDFVAVAERFLNTAYLWGGRTSIGLDCSALVQLSLMAAGKPAPRDTDLQEKLLGRRLAHGMEAKLRRGDLLYWKGHVAILTAPDGIVHASGHHMTVVTEPLAVALARIGPPTSVKRID